jgi:5-methylthioadenosine/S-adenosylhomocysteine deaminase
MTAKMLIKGGHILSMDATIGDFVGDVLVVDGKIAAVAPTIDAGDAEIVNAAGMIVLPGFVDTHRHFWQTQLRGIAADWSLFEYVVLMRHGFSTSYDAEDAYIGNHVGALEALNAGVTSIVDHSHLQISEAHSDALVQGLKDAGIRGIFCYGMYENPRREGDQVASTVVHQGISDFHHTNARRVRDTFFTGGDELLRFGVASTEWSRLTETGPAVEEIGLLRTLEPARISIHIGTGINEQVRFIPDLAAAGLLGDDLLFSHGAHLTDGDLELLARHGGFLSTTPDTELQMGMGYPVAERVARSGKEPSLGADIVSNVGGDLFAQMRLLLQVWRFNDYQQEGFLPMTPRHPVREMVRMATLGGATAAGLSDRVGSLTPGKAADIVLIRTDAINMAPMNDAAAAVVFYANPSDVDSVFVAGRAVKRHGALCGHDWPATRARLLASRDRIMTRYARVETKGLMADFGEVWKRLTRHKAALVP